MKKGIYILPNLFTTGSLLCGVYSIVSAIEGNFTPAAIAIMISIVLDGLDGRIARITNTTSNFGVEYDSLADLIAFGVAPAILTYSWALAQYGRLGWLTVFLFIACGALRLARFNTQIGIIESTVFNGLPIPAAAGVVSTSVLLYFYLGGEGQYNHLSIPVCMFLLSLLMVSNVKYYSFKDMNFFADKPFVTLIFTILVLTVIILEPQIMLFTLAAFYGISGPLWFLIRLAKKKDFNNKEEKYEHHI